MAGRRFGAAPGDRPPPPREPARAAQREFELRLPVARPRLLVACKDTAPGRRGNGALWALAFGLFAVVLRRRR